MACRASSSRARRHAATTASPRPCAKGPTCPSRRHPTAPTPSGGSRWRRRLRWGLHTVKRGYRDTMEHHIRCAALPGPHVPRAALCHPSFLATRSKPSLPCSSAPQLLRSAAQYVSSTIAPIAHWTLGDSHPVCWWEGVFCSNGVAVDGMSIRQRYTGPSTSANTCTYRKYSAAQAICGRTDLLDRLPSQNHVMLASSNPQRPPSSTRSPPLPISRCALPPHAGSCGWHMGLAGFAFAASALFPSRSTSGLTSTPGPCRRPSRGRR